MVLSTPYPSQRRSSSFRQERVPKTLQVVFMMSSRGMTIDSPPPENVLSKAFFKNWLFQRQTTAPKVLRELKQVRYFFSNTNDQHHSPSPPDSSKPASPQLSQQQQQTKDDHSRILQTPKPSPNVTVTMSPQGFLDSLLSSRGYSCQKYSSLQSAYFNKPTPLQMASYHGRLLELIKQGDGIKLREIIMAGLSRNPCNQHGESLIHTICRRGDYKLLHTMIDAGATVQVSDDHGRTPLHDACWSSAASFAVVDIILQQDIRLLHMMDIRGATPLMHVPREDWTSWHKFLRSRLNLYWPPRTGEKGSGEGPPPLTLEGPNTRPLPDPTDALPLEIATMIATGRITPHDAATLRAEAERDDECSDFFGSDFSFSDSEDSEDYKQENQSATVSRSSVFDDESEDDSYSTAFDVEDIAELICGITEPGTQHQMYTAAGH